ELATYGANFPKNYKRNALVLANSPAARRLPPSKRFARWLVAGTESGRIPGPGPHVSPTDAATAALTLGLSPYGIAARHGRCRLVRTDTLVLETGDQIIAISGTFNLVSVTDSGATSRYLKVAAPRRFQDVMGRLSLRITRKSAGGRATVAWCTLRPSGRCTRRR